MVEAFAADASADAYERLVDRLLQSPHWGEHRARYWLDAARYADTNGIHFDNYRRDLGLSRLGHSRPSTATCRSIASRSSNWRAICCPRPRSQQQVATGFNRCNTTTNEGGVIDEEYLVLYARDRTETTARVWLGLTAGCAVCHDHKFDPLSQKEFYQMSAFFNNTTQAAMDGNVKDTPPTVFLPAPQDRAALACPGAGDGRGQAAGSPPARSRPPPDLQQAAASALGAGAGAAVRIAGHRGARDAGARRTADGLRAVPRRVRQAARGGATPATPAFLPPMPAELPKNRLGLARWLMRPEHPLTARVAVNRFWQEVFGTGLVRTAEDFGVNGEMPSNAELLDWLAVEFRESGWDVKRLFRLLVTSAAYRQAAVARRRSWSATRRTACSRAGPRFRMDAEMVRDYALAASGLLVPKIGGPSVKPYQPEGVWEAVAMTESNTRDYHMDSGESLYRRSLYTFWKRSAPPASMEIFNAPDAGGLHRAARADRTRRCRRW